MNRQHQAVPLHVGHPKAGPKGRAAGHAGIAAVALAAEKDRAGIAGAMELPRFRLEQMRMLGRDLETAKIAPFNRLSRPDKPA